MSNKYIADIIEIISRPLEDLKQGRVDLVDIRLEVSRKKITGRIGVKERNEREEEDEH